MPPSRIPPFYRIFFTIIDPIITILGIYAQLLTPLTVLTSYTPTPHNPPGTETVLLLDTVAAFLAGLLILQVYLLRARPADMT
ncbi:MAG: hypothetical protein Q9171_006007, partial [Xanthocarpia ochracea]